MNNIDSYKAMNDEGIRNEIDYLNKVAGRIEGYNVFAESDQGKFFVTDMKQRLAFTRRQYKNIDSTKPEGLILLAMMSAKELELMAWIAKLKGDKDSPKAIAENIEALGMVLKHRREQIKPRASMVPSEVKKDMEG